MTNIDVPMMHDGYLKIFQISRPQLKFDFILFDEAQDCNPATLQPRPSFSRRIAKRSLSATLIRPSTVSGKPSMPWRLFNTGPRCT